MARRQQPAIKVEGLRELRKALKDADDDAQDLKDANREAGQIVTDEARSIVPKLSGRLESTIRPVGQLAGISVKAGGSSLPYAGVIHFGWPAHNIEPVPFLYDAIDNRRDEVIAAYQRNIDKIAERV